MPSIKSMQLSDYIYQFGMPKEQKLFSKLTIIFALITVFVTVAIVTTYVLVILYFKDFVSQQSSKVIQIESSNQLSILSIHYEQRITTILNISKVKSKQQILQRMYNWVELHENVKVDPPLFCPTFVSIDRSISNFCLMAYPYLANNISQIEAQMTKQFRFVSMFNEYILPFDATQFVVTGIAYTVNQSIPILGTWPMLNASIGYNAHKRSWYLNHISKMGSGNSHIFSDLFTTIINSYTIAVSRNITDQYGKYTGIVFNLLDFQSFKSNFGSNYMLINQQGQLILSFFKYPPGTTKPLYIMNSSLTGFDQQDWEEIQKASQNVTAKSNCQLSEFIDTGFLCRFNAIFEQDLMMVTTQLKEPPYTMVVFVNSTEILTSILELHAKIQNKFLESLLNSLITLVCTIFGLFLFMMLALRHILRPLATLINHTKEQSQGGAITNHAVWRQVREFNEQDLEDDSTFGNLKRAYLYMVRQAKTSSKKSQICLEIESKPFPKKNWKYLVAPLFKVHDKSKLRLRVNRYL